MRLRWSARCQGGFTVFAHPHFATRLDRGPIFVLHHLAVLNYGDFAPHEGAEIFGAAALGPGRDSHYAARGDLTDELAAAARGEPSGCPSR